MGIKCLDCMYFVYGFGCVKRGCDFIRKPAPSGVYAVVVKMQPRWRQIRRLKEKEKIRNLKDFPRFLKQMIAEIKR